MKKVGMVEPTLFTSLSRDVRKEEGCEHEESSDVKRAGMCRE